MNKVVKIFLVHLGIFLAYFIAVSMKFVFEKSPNPIGHGLLMWICMFIQVAVTIYWIGTHWKTLSKPNILIHVAALLLPIVLFLIFNDYVYQLLWKWRGD